MTRAIYVRTSPGDNDGAAQLFELRTYARSAGWYDNEGNGPREYVDLDTSGKRDSRPAWDELRREVRRGRVKVWVATELARLGRGGVAQVAPFLDECTERGVRVVLTRQAIDNTTPMGRFVVHVLLEVAAMERETIVERVRAGVRRAQAEGTRSGRPIGRPRVEVDEARLKEAARARDAGAPWREIAAHLGVPEGTARRLLAGRQNPNGKRATGNTVNGPAQAIDGAAVEAP